ncbi:MAG: IMS domain-containing protein [Sphingomicrobium sp.]
MKYSSADRSTPDKSITSFFEARNAKAQLNCYIRDKIRSDGKGQFDNNFSEVRKYYLSFFTGKALTGNKPKADDQDISQCLKKATKLSLEIKEVKEETPTRAIVIANIRNITAIPDGATVDDFDKKRRADGEDFKYELTKEKSEWRISQVYSFDDIEKHDWEVKYKDDDGPYVPSIALPVDLY